MENALYPNWHHMWDTTPKKADKPHPYKMQKDNAKTELSIEEELNTASVFDPLASDSQSSSVPSSQPIGASNSQPGKVQSPVLELAGPKTLHRGGAQHCFSL